MRRISNIFLPLILVSFLPACEEATDYYLGVNQQPEFVEDTYQEGMNLFAILRPDRTETFNKSFVYMQEVTLALSGDPFRFLPDAKVEVIDFSRDLPDTIDFPLMFPDNNFSDSLYRPVSDFNPEPRKRYRLRCSHPNLPDAVGEAWFPPAPEIMENSLEVSGTLISFELINDSLIGLVDVHYYRTDEDRGILGRFVPSDEYSTRISVNLPGAEDAAELIIYAYDANLANYYANSNTSLNFNKYRTTISTLESGFGVFGALNYSRLYIK